MGGRIRVTDPLLDVLEVFLQAFASVKTGALLR